ncbi:MAG TPA: hypothetical protein DD641_08030 [Deltaproteobacteria bacterium]|nr:hypothetical protein [Deltaproteobacteria bacterium]
MKLKKRAFMPSFFILLSFCFSLIASILAGEAYRWGALTCLLVLFFKPLLKKLPITLLSVTVIFFSLYLLGHMFFLNPQYRSSGIYQPLYLLLSFIVFSNIERETVKRIFKYAVFILVFLSFWAFAQYFAGIGIIVNPSPGRSNAIFFTPNTFATAINLFLLPLIALYVYPAPCESARGYDSGTKKILICVLILYAALLTANSRGGYLALTAGVMFFFSFLLWRILKEYRHRLLILAAGLATVTLLFKLFGIMGLAGLDTKRVFDTFEHGDTNRLVLYSIAWELIKENPWWGFGFFNFSSLFAIHKIPPFLGSATNFVHNDYLQFWLENGLLGLLSLLAVIISFYFSVLKKRDEILKQQPPVLIMAGAAVTTIFAHAVVDFPLYLPPLLIVLGAFLGTANRELTDIGLSQFQLPKNELLGKIGLSLNRIGLRTEFLRKVMVSLIILWLAMPMLAETASDIGIKRLGKGDARGGIYWHAMARNIQPRNAVYYWQEGVIWRDQATTLENPDAAQKAAEKADKLFLAGINANHYYDIQNLAARILLHRDNRNLLEKPATLDELVSWAERLRSIDPHSIGVQVEYVRTLAFAGKKKEAMLFAKQMQNKYPESQLIKNLIKDLEQGVY